MKCFKSFKLSTFKTTNLNLYSAGLTLSDRDLDHVRKCFIKSNPILVNVDVEKYLLSDDEEKNNFYINNKLVGEFLEIELYRRKIIAFRKGFKQKDCNFDYDDSLYLLLTDEDIKNYAKLSSFNFYNNNPKQKIILDKEDYVYIASGDLPILGKKDCLFFSLGEFNLSYLCEENKFIYL